MSGDIGMTDASHRRVFSTETYSTRSITLDDDSNSEVGPVVHDDEKEAENNPIFRFGVRKDEENSDVLTFNDGGENGDDDDSINSEDDFEDNDFDALVGEFFWFLRNKENDRTPLNSPRTPRSGGVLTPRRSTSMMSPSSKGSYRPLVYRDTEGAFPLPVTPKASGRPYESVPIQVISLSKDVETETASSAPVFAKTIEYGDENVSPGVVVEKEASPYTSISLKETHHCEENVAGETSVFLYNIDNDETSKASVFSKRIEHDDVIAPNEVEPRSDNVDTEETTSISSKHLPGNNVEKEIREENVPNEASFFSDIMGGDETSKASVSLEEMDHDDVVVAKDVESRFDNFDTQNTSPFSSKENIHDDEKSQLIEDTQMTFVTQALLLKNDQHFKAYEKWVKKGLMPKVQLIEGKQGDSALRPNAQDNDQQSKAYAVWEKRGMMSPESTPNKEAVNSSSMTENHQQYQQSKAHYIWKEKSLMNPEQAPNNIGKERAPAMKANDQPWKRKGQISHEPTSSKAVRSARVASLLARSKRLLGKDIDIASFDKPADPDGCLQDAPAKDPVYKPDDPSPEATEALVTSSNILTQEEPSGAYSTLPRKSVAPGERRVSFDAKFLVPLDAGEESVVSVFSISPSPKSLNGTKLSFAFSDMPSQPSTAHSTDSASEMEGRSSLDAPGSNSTSQTNPRLTHDSDCEARCTFYAVPDGLPSDTEPRVTFDAHLTDSYSSEEPCTSFDTRLTESADEQEPRSSPIASVPNSASPRKHSTKLDPLCKFDALLTPFDILLIESCDWTGPKIGKEPTISFEDTEPTTTSEPPIGTIDSPPAVSTSGADPDGIIFDIPSTDAVNGKELTPILDDVVPDVTSALEPNSTIAVLSETRSDTEPIGIKFNARSPDSDPKALEPNSSVAFLGEMRSDAEPTGVIFNARSPDSEKGREPRPIFQGFVQSPTIAPEPNGTTTFLIESLSNTEPVGIITDAPLSDSTNEKELGHIFDDAAPRPCSALDPNGTTIFLYKSPIDVAPAGIIFDAPSPDFANGKEPMHVIDDVASRGDAAPTGCILDTPPANKKEVRLIFNDTIPDATGSSEPSDTVTILQCKTGMSVGPTNSLGVLPPGATGSSEPSDAIATLPCKTDMSVGPTNSLGVLPPESFSDTLGTLVMESARGVEPSSNQSAHPPDYSIREKTNNMISTFAIEPASDAASSCTFGTPASSLEELSSSSATCSIKSTYTKETSSSIISSTDSAISAKGTGSTVVTVLVYSATGMSISSPSSINGVEEERSGTESLPSAPLSGRIIYSPTGTRRRSRDLIIPRVDNPRSTSIAPQIVPGLVAKRCSAFDSPKPKAMSARDNTLGASPHRLKIPSRLTSMENTSSTSIAPPTKPKSAEKHDLAQSGAIGGKELSSTLGGSPCSLSISPHLTKREKPSISIASPTKHDSVEKRSSDFDFPRPEPMRGRESSSLLGSIPVSGRKQSNATSANSAGEETSNVFASPPKPSLKRSSGNFSSILLQWQEKSEHNPNGHFLMSPSKDVTSPRTPSKTPPSRILSPPGKSRSTTPTRSSSKDVSTRTWSPSQTKTAEAPCTVISPARSQTSSQSRKAEVPIAASFPTRSFSPIQSDEPDLMPSAVSSITTNDSKADDKSAFVRSSVFSKASMPKQYRTEDIPSVINAPTPSKALSQTKTEDIPSVSSRAWTPSRHLKNKKNVAKSSKVTNEPCSCSCESSSPFSGNDQLVEFFLPKLGMAHTCGKRDPPILIDSDPIALKHILRSWQVEFLKSVDIYRGDQLVKECNARAGTLAGAMRKWRLQNNLNSPKTISCGMALHIWSRTCKYYVRSIRRQMADGLVEVEPPTLSEVMSSFLDKDNGVSVPVERRMSLLTMGEPNSQREM